MRRAPPASRTTRGSVAGRSPPRRLRHSRSAGRPAILSPMAFTLAGIDNDYSFELRPGTTMVVGRAVSSDCAIVDATVSRRHAELAVKDNGFELKDLGSSNGTFVNGVKV